jgi:hypothetical protein
MMRVTLGELLGKITPEEGEKLEREIEAATQDGQDEESLRVLQGPRKTNGVEVIVRRGRPS